MSVFDLLGNWAGYILGLPPTLIAFFLISDEVKAFKAARVFFVSSAIWTWGKVIWWGMLSLDSFFTRAAAIFLACGLIGVGLTEALRLTTRREKQHFQDRSGGASQHDPLYELTDKQLLDSVQPLMSKMQAIIDEYKAHVASGRDQSNARRDRNLYIVEQRKAAQWAAIQYRDCCAEQALTFHRSLAWRVNSGMVNQKVQNWTTNLLHIRTDALDPNDKDVAAAGIFIETTKMEMESLCDTLRQKISE